MSSHSLEFASVPEARPIYKPTPDSDGLGSSIGSLLSRANLYFAERTILYVYLYTWTIKIYNIRQLNRVSLDRYTDRHIYSHALYFSFILFSERRNVISWLSPAQIFKIILALFNYTSAIDLRELIPNLKRIAFNVANTIKYTLGPYVTESFFKPYKPPITLRSTTVAKIFFAGDYIS